MTLETAPSGSNNAFTRNHTDTVTIANGQTTSDEFILGGRAVDNIHLPTVSAAYFTYLVKINPGDTAVQLVDTTGAAISFPRGSSATTTGAKAYTEAALAGFYSVQIVSSAAQGGDRVIGISARGQDPVPFKPAPTGGVVPGDFAAPALTLGTSNVAGSSGKVLATDSTILTFDGTVPATQTNPSTATVGNATVAARRNHVHGIATPATPTSETNPATAGSGAGTGFATDTHLHGIPAPGTVSTITSGASPGNGAGTGFATDTHIHGAPTIPNAPTIKYKSATQTYSASSSFADVTATSGSFAFAIGTNEVWQVDILLFMTFTGTGGFKMQFTGPASPTRIDVAFELPLEVDGGGSAVTNAFPPTLGSSNGSAFSVTFGAAGATAAGGAGTYQTGSPSFGTQWPLKITATIANGANAGTVTLQAAQNSNNGTAVIGIGSRLNALKVA